MYSNGSSSYEQSLIPRIYENKIKQKKSNVHRKEKKILPRRR